MSRMYFIMQSRANLDVEMISKALSFAIHGVNYLQYLLCCVFTRWIPTDTRTINSPLSLYCNLISLV